MIFTYGNIDLEIPIKQIIQKIVLTNLTNQASSQTKEQIKKIISTLCLKFRKDFLLLKSKVFL